MDITEIKNHWAIPKHHPISSANPAPWKVEEVKLNTTFDKGIRVRIRGKDSMWFDASNCYLGDEEEMRDFMLTLEHKRLVQSLCFEYNCYGQI